MTDEKTTPDNPEEAAIDDETVRRAPEPVADDAGSEFEVAEVAAAEAGPIETDPVVDPVVADEPGPYAADPVVSADESASTTEAPESAPGTPGGPAPHHGVGPFSIREVALGGIWLLAFIVSFFPIYGGFASGATVWNGGIDWVLTIGVPTVAVFLLALRRLSPQGIRRVGSLGIDQFASVAFSVSAVIWLGILWGAVVSLGAGRVFIATWVVWVEFFLMLAGVFLTVLAPFIAPFNEDFRSRPETVAHRVARPARPVTARPAAPASHTGTPDAAAPYGAPTGAYGSPTGAYASPAGGYASPAAAYGSSTDAHAAPADAVTGQAGNGQEFMPSDETSVIEQQSAPAATQAFWALAPVERDVVDEQGLPVFTIGPTAWALVIEDRGDTFVVRHEDGRIGYLTDVSGVTRG